LRDGCKVADPVALSTTVYLTEHATRFITPLSEGPLYELTHMQRMTLFSGVVAAALALEAQPRLPIASRRDAA
jgi:hypothetical protein